MRQAIPQLHPTLTENYPAAAAKFFDADARDRIADKLFARSTPEAHQEEVLDRISIACWLYAHNHTFSHTPLDKQRKTAGRIGRTVQSLLRLLEEADRDTYRRIAMAMGEQANEVKQVSKERARIPRFPVPHGAVREDALGTAKSGEARCSCHDGCHSRCVFDGAARTPSQADTFVGALVVSYARGDLV